MAQQGRRLCHPGPGWIIRRQDRRLLHQRGRPAAVRDRLLARRRRLSGAFRLAQRAVAPNNFANPEVVIAGLVPAISFRQAGPCRTKRDGRDKPGHDEAEMNIAVWLHRAGLSHGGLPAVGLGARTALTYGDLAERAARLAGALRQNLRLAPGDRVAIVARNCVEYLELLYGIWHAGAAAVPVNAKLHAAEIAFILEHAGARACFASPGLDTDIAPHAPNTLERLIAVGGAEYATLFGADAVAVAPREDRDLAWLFYTSGTTGRPKGAMLTHGVLAAASFAYAAEVDAVAPGDALLH